MQSYSNTSDINAQWAFQHYESIRHTLPRAAFPQTSMWVNGLADVAQHFDVFLLDAFGVLNVGQTAIKTAPAAVKYLQSAGKKVMVLTNGASLPAFEAQQKLQKMGFNFALHNIVASRDALCKGLIAAFPSHKTHAFGGSWLGQIRNY